uniref:Uncharacterized protein n=1 Tax=Nelumbo nucifera TaxID=4432 RepID=A0A822YXL7_NELNU|nr:TPA_asm: hypothetical protein HUJ06_007928 [Nelumbo nucifera]
MKTLDSQNTVTDLSLQFIPKVVIDFHNKIFHVTVQY